MLWLREVFWKREERMVQNGVPWMEEKPSLYRSPGGFFVILLSLDALIMLAFFYCGSLHGFWECWSSFYCRRCLLFLAFIFTVALLTAFLLISSFERKRISDHAKGAGDIYCPLSRVLNFFSICIGPGIIASFREELIVQMTILKEVINVHEFPVCIGLNESWICSDHI